ncbi:MAG: hypothetical protein D6737_00845 [Chloroflexi bacterium]|nr:MAG: hypothetical protein D6737_00845 [Chloroflexota bacterium]
MTRHRIAIISQWLLTILFLLGVGTVFGIVVMRVNITGNNASTSAFVLSDAESSLTRETEIDLSHGVDAATSPGITADNETRGFLAETVPDRPVIRIPAFEPFSLPTTNGTPAHFPDDFGEVTVLLAATVGCPSCAAEGNFLSQLMTEYEGRGLRVFIVDILPGSSLEFLRMWVNVSGTENLTWALDEDRHFSDTFNIQLLDTTIVYDASGQQVFRDEWVTSEETLRTAVERAFANNTA